MMWNPFHRIQNTVGTIAFASKTRNLLFLSYPKHGLHVNLYPKHGRRSPNMCSIVRTHSIVSKTRSEPFLLHPKPEIHSSFRIQNTVYIKNNSELTNGSQPLTYAHEKNVFSIGELRPCFGYKWTYRPCFGYERKNGFRVLDAKAMVPTVFWIQWNVFHTMTHFNQTSSSSFLIVISDRFDITSCHFLILVRCEKVIYVLYILTCNDMYLTNHKFQDYGTLGAIVQLLIAPGPLKGKHC